MPAPNLIKPDRDFLNRTLNEGGEDLKKCYQCATCSVVCDLSNQSAPFPRKEMLWAQWGLKDRLIADPDVWLCYQCNDCSKHCPRDARPGDVLVALRQESVRHYTFPRCLSNWFNQTKYLPVILLTPAILLTLALALRKPIESIKPIEGIIGFLDHHGFYADFFPHWLLIGFFSLFTGLAALAAAVGLIRFWRAMKADDAASGKNGAVLGIVPSIIRTLLSIFTHDRFSKCQAQASRRQSHIFVFYGFLSLFIVTVWAVVDIYAMPYLFGIGPSYPFKQYHPMKILANVGCLILIVGCVRIICNRLKREKESVVNTPFDWIFVGLLLGVTISGLFTEIMRVVAEPAHAAEQAANSGTQYLAFGIYFVHLVLVFDILVYLPYSRFAHIIYRTVALVYAEHSGRNRSVQKT